MVKNDTLGTIDKTAIKNFAVYSRNKLIQDIKNKAALIGISENGINEPLSTSTGNIQLFDIGMQEPYRIEGKAIEQRNALIQELKSREKDSAYEIAYETLIEEVAYTWFNRILAIRFMEVNNYMPDRMRVLSSGVEGINEPEFITHVFETKFKFSEEEKNRIIELKTDGSNLAMDEIFQILFVKQCNALNTNLSELFEKTNDYSELLLNVSYNDIEGVVYKLIHDVPEKDFDVTSENGHGQVEIIGWMYQFYNTEPKAAVFSRPKSTKIEKQDIPAATQLFTPEWIVKYMVENSLGRIWIEKLLTNGDNRTEKQIADYFGWKYYLSGAEQEDSVEKQLEMLRRERKEKSIEDITFLDPAMGSFHIGIYAFEVFMQLYESEGYTTREAAKLIVEKNLHGLDIDKRASQLSYFACMMQARKYNRRILEENLQPNVYEIPESNTINRGHLNYLGNDKDDKEEWERLKLQLVSLLDNLADAKEYGSLINISDKFEFPQLRNFVEFHPIDSQISLLETVGLEETQNELLNIINVAEIISKKYDVVITNPPYMSSSGMDKKLADFAKKYYPNSKSDMFAMFIEKCKKYTERNGYFSMITQHAWMFLSSYEKLRSGLLKNSLVNMAHLGARAFEEIGGEVVQTTSFVYLNNHFSNYVGRYVELTEFGSQSKKEEAYVDLFKSDRKAYLYENNQENFKKIPGSPVAYWASKKVYESYENFSQLGDYAEIVSGMTTGNNDKYMRDWKEIEISKINFDATDLSTCDLNKKYWFPYNKGGAFRRWYGNNDWVVNWSKSTEFNRAKTTMTHLYLKPCITWSDITSTVFSARACGSGFFFDVKGSCAFPDERLYYPLIAFLNSKMATTYIKMLNPTITTQVGDLKRIPFNEDIINSRLIELTKKCIEIAKEDYDSNETSWDFRKHPLVSSNKNLKEIFNEYKEKSIYQFNVLKNYEEEINEFIIKKYDMENFLDITIEDKYISVNIPNKKDAIQSFISYAVGCMFGRYALGNDGLVFAGGTFNSSSYSLFNPTNDNILVISEDDYFSDDITNRFVQFVRICFGSETLEDNLFFIAEALGIKGNSSREIIREYFLKFFYKDHIKTYQKRPIYWLYDSGKQNGFKALVYMHRYDENTTGKVRVNYLHQVQRAYERTIANLQEDITHSKDAKEITQLQRRIEKLIKQLKECKEYDEHLGHIALERINIDLDDGVKVNYQKVQMDNKGKLHQILVKI